MNFFVSWLLVGFLLIADSAIANPNAFSFGPYRLGMTNSEAKKFGIGGCATDSNIFTYVKCNVTSEIRSIVSEVNSASVTFDSKTKMLRKIEVSIKDGNFSDAMARLKVESCPKNWGAIGHTGWCYKAPNQTRLINIEGPCPWRYCSKSTYIKMRAELDSKHVHDFLNQRALVERQNHQVRAIQSGN